ncbi:HNH endonuclease [Daejeonella sp.]|uniref:HNH endonuclease n=1 Tax=Daejeonella sp. TaxID=2805397 RepID=UPI00359C96D8
MKKLYLVLLLLLFSICSFAQSRYISVTTKKIVYARDGGACRCCGSSLNLEYDHITPFSCGGGNDVSNIQLLCQKCNRSKSNSCTCKIHNRIVGVNCCDRSVSRNRSSASTSRKSTSTSSQCTGTTKKGARCRNRTSSTNGRCYLH